MKGGFTAGCVVGVLGALLALLLYSPVELAVREATMERSAIDGLVSWIHLNLGHSVWLFGGVLACFVVQLHRLQGLLSSTSADVQEVSRLDQILDVWIQVFIGIGVIWTAVGMRSALQAALGDPGAALSDSADNVLRKLVDGGILLALSTTIAGAVGGYAMRLVKTVSVGAQLQAFYSAHERQDVDALLNTAARIEARLSQQGRASVTELPHKELSQKELAEKGWQP